MNVQCPPTKDEIKWAQEAQDKQNRQATMDQTLERDRLSGGRLRGNQNVYLPQATITVTAGRVITMFEDGQFISAEPPDTPWHREIMAQVGCAGEPLRYMFEHEVIHSFLAQKMYGMKSYVVYGAACGKKLSEHGARCEERWCWHFHRYLNYVGPALEPEWEGWRQELIERLNA